MQFVIDNEALDKKRAEGDLHKVMNRIRELDLNNMEGMLSS